MITLRDGLATVARTVTCLGERKVVQEVDGEFSPLSLLRDMTASLPAHVGSFPCSTSKGVM